MKTYNVAILGATGRRRRRVHQTPGGARFSLGELRLLASPRSAGRTLPFAGEELVVQAVGDDSFCGIDIAFFCPAAA